ncbi:MAG: tandem-95 repeat protein [Gammaproteobacteria bacterium]|nr:tandem-95 repeat protein [Gammaproteobacteria bacterium]MBU1480225.1 tandem-95 repeat protein [Gammaproteobacteria bacterium]
MFGGKYLGDWRRIREKTNFVIPAEAGIWLNKTTGCRIKFGMTMREVLINKQHFSILEAVMNACLTTTNIMQRFHRLLGVLVLSLFSFQVMAAETPVVVSVDHRVTVTFSKVQFDAKKGIYSTLVRVRNRSGAALLSPLRLSIDQDALKTVRVLNAQGIGKDGQPYFEFALPKERLVAGGMTKAVRVDYAVEKVRQTVTTKAIRVNTVRSPFASASHVSAGVELAPLEPRAEPYALKADSGKAKVRFSVRTAGKFGTSNEVYLRSGAGRKLIAMNDLGKEGDLIAKDGIYGVNVVVDTGLLKPDSCLSYEAVIHKGRTEVVSSPLKLCVSAFPVRAAASNISKPVVLSGGTKAVADELLITVAPGVNSKSILMLAADINAKVVGSILPLNLYQLRLPEPANSSRLLSLIDELNKRSEVKSVSVNAIGAYVFTPSDTEYASQHGLQRVRAQDVWDIGATGVGVTMTVLDTGLDRTHPDFGIVGNCQLVDNDCGSANTDIVGHGTQVAGVVAAKTDNALGVAGVSYGSKIKSIQVSADAVITFAEMTQGFTDSAAYGLASVINASFIGGPWGGLVDVTPLCSAVNSAVLNAGVPIAVAVNGAGNNNVNSFYYPARCNDSVRPEHAALTNKALFITVANSASVVDPACGSVALDQRCSDSNYGAWVDMVAPGSVIRTTAVGGGYSSPSGTSLASPMIAGAAAILNSCGVPLDQIESTLRTSANVTVPFPDGSSAPRLDIYRAMMQRNQVPTGVTLSSSSLNEHINTSGGYDVGTLSAIDTDTCDKYTFSINGGADSAVFSINSATNTLRINAGVLNYLTKPSYAVTVRVTDFFGAAFDQPLTVNVINVNDPPTALVLSNTVPATPENGGNIKVADIVVTDDGLGTNLLALSGADAGSFNIAGNELYFSGSANYEVKNSYSVTVSVDDVSVGATPDASQAFSLAITNVNEAPVANNDTLAAAQDTPATYTAAQLLGNDTDVDAGTTLTISSVTSGANGTVVLNGDGTVTFTPTAGFSGTANFTYTATDGSLPSNVATVTVNVSAAVPHAPVANNDTLAATEDMPVTYTAAQLLGNDTDVDAGTTLSVASVTNGVGGTVVLNGGGTVTFTPNTNFNGTANFTYQATDGGLTSNVATVTVNVAPMNDAPTGLPFISGTRTVGQTLTANTLTATLPNPIFDADGLGAFSYEWQATGAPVGGNSDTYVLAAADIGQFMSVCVSYTDGGGTPESVCSATDATAVGDPHITTVDGLHYDFQGAGEFVALRGAKGMEIQLRMAAVPTAPPLPDAYTGLTSGASVNTAVAARVGKHRVTYQPDTSPNAAGGTFVLRVDGVPTTLPVDGIDLGDGGRVMAQASGIQIDFPDQTTLMVNTSSWPFYGAWWLHINVFHTSAYEGIMGARGKGSWLPRLANGSALGMMPAAPHDRYVELYVKFADSWRVNKETSLFDYAEGTSTVSFTNKAWPTENGPYATGSGPVAKPLGLKAAQLACRGVAGKNEKADCVFDVRVMGNANLAKGHALTQKVRTGLTAIVLRDDRGISRDKKTVTFTATVVRHAAITRMDVARKVVPTGTVQFTLNGKRVGRPVKLDSRGQARWKVESLKVEKQLVGARYLPAKGSTLLPSSSLGTARLAVDIKK